MRSIQSLLIGALVSLPFPALADAYLLMAEEKGCMYCAQWNADIGPIYPKTTEGRAAPLVRYDLHADKPEVEFAGRVLYTPTFILVVDDQEVGRIEGYPGEDFFWGLLAKLLERADIDLDTQPRHSGT
uniref:hypothetical protein n=1 Tax=Shimia sp. SK013 TaxID=1389006 RepID=UPI00187CD572|nr:hypothetical protein [Shimia sp. SK013]